MSELIKLPNKEHFTPVEAAKYLGVATSTIYSWIDTKTIRTLVVGSKLKKIPRQAILDVVKVYDPDI